MRGLNKMYKHKELKVFLQENKVGVLAITETRVKENNAVQVVMKIAKNWIWHNNYVEDPGGRIWILWNPKMVEFQLVSTHRQVIHGSVKVRGSYMRFDLSMVYGLHTYLDRRDMWYELNQYNMRCTQP
ncbi:hypothetical protein R3W88_004301 [Solanum pinnatisectum]|uniref:Uncharacterized protein n=1 Tax=Solanum pinnatisectum TaxID=50273 RepID=A0AAV9K9C9_9SOLN|nr:hypothetical protein R3W88_004301 [Solanum pinnatisectum]